MFMCNKWGKIEGKQAEIIHNIKEIKPTKMP
jgi:hypothetical protein